MFYLNKYSLFSSSVISFKIVKISITTSIITLKFCKRTKFERLYLNNEHINKNIKTKGRKEINFGVEFSRDMKSISN